ncbi:MAG: pyridoxal phosphate-dependent aminotransferase [Candidatus Omnitrophica bacterium]|nr:pyridoxal phosphate-dependent aminotransferase [Candidatus Omnitrophota bacterium]
MAKLADRVSNVSPSLTLAITAKAKKMKIGGIDVVSFGAGEPDFDTPQHIKTSAINAIKEGFTKYTPASGMPELKTAISGKLKRDNMLEYPSSSILISCGAKHSLYNIFQALCQNGDEVIIPSPYWLSYPEMVRLSGAKPVFLKTEEKDSFKIKKDALKKALSKNTKAIIINSPSNPTGAVYEKNELQEIADIAVSKNIFVISDEIYEHLIYDDKDHVSIAALGGDVKKNTLLVNGVSKSFSMTGWRIGYLAADDGELLEAINKIQSHSTSNPSSISQKAALEAINGDQASVTEMRDEFESRRDYIQERIQKIKGLSAIKPSGAFYLFCNIEKLKLDSVLLANKMLDEIKVAVIPGKPFGSDNHIRLSFASGIDEIKKGMDRIEEWVAAKRL